VHQVWLGKLASDGSMTQDTKDRSAVHTSWQLKEMQAILEEALRPQIRPCNLPLTL
jgi:hypothetical protein